ncbi:unnamed protein product [Mytilus edulis]|uniref:Uncharacterized protein n=1 Tax=Mytilus edulis TaxID=6550 RepID=A0A8S3QHJ9_MYTED|nr:unnamed protein product [Mytilus edulis]
MIHDKIYETAVVVCGNENTECFISNASSIFIRDHFIFESLTNQQTDDDLKDQILLSEACEKGHTNVVQLLLANNENISLCNSDRDTPLHVACEGSHAETVKLLLQLNANKSLCNSYGESPLDVARDGNHTDTVNLLMQNNEDASKSECVLL